MTDLKGRIYIQGRLVATVDFETPKDERGERVPVQEGSIALLLIVDPNDKPLYTEGRLQ